MDTVCSCHILEDQPTPQVYTSSQLVNFEASAMCVLGQFSLTGRPLVTDTLGCESKYTF